MGKLLIEQHDKSVYYTHFQKCTERFGHRFVLFYYNLTTLFFLFTQTMIIKVNQNKKNNLKTLKYQYYLLNLLQNLIYYLPMGNLNRLKAVLADAGQTNKWLAEQLGKDPVTISKWCTNTTQPDLQTLSTIASLLNVDIRELIVSTKK